MDSSLIELAGAYGIATEYWDWQGRHVEVTPETVAGVLAGLGVDASTPERAGSALRDHQDAPWRRMLPRCVALREHRTQSVAVHVTHGDPVELWIELENGDRRDGLRQLENWTPPRDVDGRLVGEASFEIPADLPLGYHTLRARSHDVVGSMPLIVTPAWLGFPQRMGRRRAWGLATQLYSVRSAQSWGVGDLVDLTDLAVWSAAEHGGDYVLINPLHAAEPLAPMEPSPYLPTSRRFANPLYLRPERIAEYADCTDDQRSRIRALVGGLDPRSATIDRNRAWTAKREALQLVFAVPRTPGRQLALDAYRRREGAGLEAYATWCVLTEVHGRRQDWPAGFEHPTSPAVAEFAAAHAEQVEFHCWLQWLLDAQLGEAQEEAVRAGMALGIMHDLAVGVHPHGADAWALQDTYARGIHVGAPPDPYNQNGQNWTQPPWRPDALADAGYEPFRRMVSTILRHAGGVRVDHVIGLFRLWWIPFGNGPKDGTYVRYDHEAMIGILALEAHRAGALVVGEDLGTVEPWVRDYLRERGILGTSILWFEFEWDAGGAPLRPEWWREYCLASVTTHDLPPTAGYLAGDHVRLRDQLGVLTRPLAEELEVDAAERQAWLDNLVDRGALQPGASVEETVKALHRYLTWTPSRLLCVSLTDAVGDRRTQNQPGTVDEYPNWRVPLSGPDGEVVMLEDVFTSRRARELVEVVNGRR
ncbi:MAG TPA: 4-alpha-glucanotransferase [Microlunatus sp.]|nr:4-alpha-glucanotransferase [Microlunatus sp.]